MRRLIHLMVALPLLLLPLTSCVTSRPTQVVEYVPITADLPIPVFPTLPEDISDFRDLTDEQWLSIVTYMVRCEEFFDVIAVRESLLAGGGS